MSSRLSIRWLHVAVVLGVVTLLVTAWFLAPSPLSPEEFSRWLEPHRQAWYALPVVGLTFVVLGLVMVVNSVLTWLVPRVRHIEAELPDAIPDKPRDNVTSLPATPATAGAEPALPAAAGDSRS